MYSSLLKTTSAVLTTMWIAATPTSTRAEPAQAPVTFLGALAIPADATDHSGLKEPLEDGTPADRLGGIGSAVAWTGRGHEYLLLADRGPNAKTWNPDLDNTTSFAVRFHLAHIEPEQIQPDVWTIHWRLLETRRLRDEKGRHFVGRSDAWDENMPTRSLRRDPEALRIGSDGTIWIADEYGPYLERFDAGGRRLAGLDVPFAFQCLHPGPTKKSERSPVNTTGRQPNKGFEGLALTPDDRRIIAATQSPLIQDLPAEGNHNAWVRLLEIDLHSGTPRQYAYPLDEPELNVCEIEAVDEARFVVLERDGKAGELAQIKRLYLIDLRGADDVSALTSLRQPHVIRQVRAVHKHLVVDLINGTAVDGTRMAGYERWVAVLSRDRPLDLFPEKLEGLALGPQLSDGRRLMCMTSDNDFSDTQPTWIFFFAVDLRKLQAASHSTAQGHKPSNTQEQP